MTDTLLNIWIGWMPFAFIWLAIYFVDDWKDGWSHWVALLVCSIGWPVYYTLALFHKRRGLGMTYELKRIGTQMDKNTSDKIALVLLNEVANNRPITGKQELELRNYLNSDEKRV